MTQSVIMKASTALASTLVILVNFLSLPLCVTASVLEAYPVVIPVADLPDVNVIIWGHICFRLKAKIIEANFSAYAFNGRAGYRNNLLRCKVSLFEDRKCSLFYDHGRKVGGAPDQN